MADVLWVAAAVVVSLVAIVGAARGLSRMHGGLAISPGNPWNCVACHHLPAAHEDGKGGLGPCWGWPASQRRWWRPRGCHCAGYVARETARG